MTSFDQVAAQFALWLDKHDGDEHREEAFAKDFPELVAWAEQVEPEELMAWSTAQVVRFIVAGRISTNLLAEGVLPVAPEDRESVVRAMSDRLIGSKPEPMTDEEWTLLHHDGGAMFRYAALGRMKELGLLEGLYQSVGAV